MTERIERKLTTILAADVADYTGHMRADEAAALAALRDGRTVMQRLIQGHGGRVANTAGDGLIAEFPSVVEAVRCSVDAQQELGALLGANGQPMRFRIGVHLDDVMVDGEDLLGDGVNLAARLQQMAEPGGILVSRQVHDHVARKLRVGFESIGERRPKHLDTPVEVFRVRVGDDLKPVPASPAEAISTEPPRHYAALLTTAFGLLVVDLLTAGGPWAQFPIIVLVTIWAMRATAVWAPRWLPHGPAALGAGVAGLVAMNLATWTGDLWSVWPAAAVGTWLVARGLHNRDAG